MIQPNTKLHIIPFHNSNKALSQGKIVHSLIVAATTSAKFIQLSTCSIVCPRHCEVAMSHFVMTCKLLKNRLL